VSADSRAAEFAVLEGRLIRNPETRFPGNDGYPGAIIPFGGARQSGIGTEFAEEGLAQFPQLQIINEART
jgi:acyl-CoA reductase-like NAD-dependent aldehyde dehydrogenase